MAKEIKTHTIHRDIKAIDKVATAAQHIKHSSVRVKEGMERTQQQNENSPVEYAQDRVADSTERFARDVASQVRKQSGKAINHIKKKQQIKREVNRIQTELREGRIFKQGERPFFSPTDGEKVYQPKEQMIKNAQSQAVRKKNAERSEKNFQKITGQAVRTVEREERNIKTTRQAGQTIKSTGKGTVKTAGRSVKTAKQTARTTVKTTEQAAKNAYRTAKASRKTAEKAAKAAEKTAEKAVKATAKTTISAAKAVIEGTKALMTAIAAGGWIAILILIIVLRECNIKCVSYQQLSLRTLFL